MISDKYTQLTTVLINTSDASEFRDVLKKHLQNEYNNGYTDGYTDGYYDASYNQEEE